jgi:hypothetical protein
MADGQNEACHRHQENYRNEKEIGKAHNKKIRW